MPARLFLYGTTTAMLAFILAPLAIAVAMSFSDSPFARFPPVGFTFRWYSKVLHDQDFLASLQFSALLALVATLGALATGTPAAFALVRSGLPATGVVNAVLLSPLVFPVLVTGLALLVLFNTVGSNDTRVNLVITHTLVTMPYVVRTVTASLMLADRALEDAARTLGAGPWRTFRRVTVPQILPGLITGAVFAFMISLDNYPASMWLADARYVPLPLLVYQLVARIFDPSLAAISSLMIILAMLAVLLLERLVGLRKAMGI